MEKRMYNGQEVEVLDLTPTWSEILSTLLLVYRDANEKGRSGAVEELQRMAKAADLSNTFLEYIKYTDTILEAKEMPLTFDAWKEWKNGLVNNKA